MWRRRNSHNSNIDVTGIESQSFEGLCIHYASCSQEAEVPEQADTFAQVQHDAGRKPTSHSVWLFSVPFSSTNPMPNPSSRNMLTIFLSFFMLLLFYSILLWRVEVQQNILV